MKVNYLLYGVIAVIVAVGIFLMIQKPSYTPGPDVDPFKGSENASVIITEYSDFQCPYCGRAAPTVKQVISTYGDRIKFVYKDFPLRSHENAERAAEAAQCALDQGKFWEYHDKLFSNQNKLFANDLKGYAKELGLNESKFNACLDSGVMAARVQRDLEEGGQLGVTGTPTFFVNGQKMVSAQSFSEFQRVIDSKL